MSYAIERQQKNQLHTFSLSANPLLERQNIDLLLIKTFIFGVRFYVFTVSPAARVVCSKTNHLFSNLYAFTLSPSLISETYFLE